VYVLPTFRHARESGDPGQNAPDTALDLRLRGDDEQGGVAYADFRNEILEHKNPILREPVLAARAARYAAACQCPKNDTPKRGKSGSRANSSGSSDSSAGWDEVRNHQIIANALHSEMC
jgi:hypothetical protein